MLPTMRPEMRRLIPCFFLMLTFVGAVPQTSHAQDSSIFVWPDLAPGETSNATGTLLPSRPQDQPTITRIEKIRRPGIDIYPAKVPNGTAILIVPGGGFARVVPDLEGSEAAPMLNEMGITVFVLRYRTHEVTPEGEPSWRRPLQDAQRSLRIIRSRADEWKINPDQVGVMGFSAGGQVSSILHTGDGVAAYESIDKMDRESCLPNFSLLIYPWRILQPKTEELLAEIKVGPSSPPAFLVHTHDDASSSLGAVMLYAAFKRNKVSAELHVYQNGGHGYGTRHRDQSTIGTWPSLAAGWLQSRKLGRVKSRGEN